ncbi:hypothetical protein ACFS5L_40270 [Streptomyces phyllanthi]|uniref:Uncharacterized protein n=1 Tax=Streptomyces phyllanthi TaxID=1803180 RepID=A0A5N8W689_9ACTN|nr:hypothetical protein [Streptomyces phyllanthi]MPY42991.1 hypothetical protein [Streptomyces phyllanthi]
MSRTYDHTYVHDVAFRERSRRLRAWGLGLLSVAGLLWVWCAVLVLTPYETEKTLDDGRTSTTECESRLFTEGDTANSGRWSGGWCASERDWPEVAAVLGVSVPVSIVGTILFTTGAVSVRLSEHGEELARLREQDARSTA